MSKATKRGKAWNIRVYDYTDEDGKRHNRSFTAPTKVEVELMVAEFKASKKKRTHDPSDMTVEEAVEKHIKLKALLSPTTTDSYKSYSEFAFQDLMKVKVSKLTDTMVQEAINKESRRVSEYTHKVISAKTVKNEWRLISGALREVCHLTFSPTLPTSHKHIKELPEVDEVISAVKGSRVELPCLLALWLSFSMSEIRGIKCSDIKNGYITINRVRVDTRQGSILKDNAKVETRLRRHKIPPYIMSLINDTSTYQSWLKSGKNDLLIPLNRKSIYEPWKAICNAHGWELSFHDLRHINCSVMASLRIPDKIIQERGGWKSDFVPKSVYTHSFSSDRERADELVDNFFDSIIQNVPKDVTKESETP